MRRDRRTKISARRRAEDHKSGFESTSVRLPEGFKFWKPDKAGVKRLDILPFKVGKGNPYADEGEMHFERTYWVHRGIGPNNASYVCPLKTAQLRCPVCEHVGRLSQDKNRTPDMDDTIKALLPKERQLWALVDLGEKDKGVQIWDVSYHLFGKQLDDAIKASDEDEGHEFFADPTDGMTVKVGIDEESFNGNTFYKTVSVGFKERVEGYDEDFLTGVPCLDEMLILVEYEALRRIFLQVEEEPLPKTASRSKSVAADDDEEEITMKRKPVAKAKAKPVVEEDEDEEEEDAEETVKMKPKAGVKKATAAVDDDDDDWGPWKED